MDLIQNIIDVLNFLWHSNQTDVRIRLIVRATQMSYGAWLYIRWSISSSPVAMTSMSACGTLALISPSGPKHWRWATCLCRFHLHYCSVISQLVHGFLVIENLVTTATIMKRALLFLRLRCNRICVDRMFDWACMCVSLMDRTPLNRPASTRLGQRLL